LLLDGFLAHSSPPTPRKSVADVWIEPSHPTFSGFVFKIQANMDPLHRDRVAFVRIVSGKFERNMSVIHVRTGKKIRVSNASKIFGGDRETVEEAYPGDVVGIVGNHFFAIGDTITEDLSLVYDEIPYFAPECFSYIENTVPSQMKRFRNGLEQLLQEGVMQAYEIPDAMRKTPLLGAAGPLQFEIVQYRLETEYGASARLQSAPWTATRWVDPDASLEGAVMAGGVQAALDGHGAHVLLFENDWSIRYFMERNPEIALSTIPFGH